MFRMVSPPIIRSSYHRIYSIWHYWDRYCYLLWTWLNVTVTVIRAPDDGCTYRPKHVEQFADINKLNIVESCWTIIDTHCAVHYYPTAVHCYNISLRNGLSKCNQNWNITKSVPMTDVCEYLDGSSGSMQARNHFLGSVSSPLCVWN